MKPFRAFFCIALVLLILIKPAAGAPGQATLLVRLRSATTLDEQSQLFQTLGATVHGQIPQLDLLCVSVPAAQAKAALAVLNSVPAVAYAESNAPARAALWPNDPAWEQQWGAHKIGGSRAWDITTGNSDVVIAVLDSGMALRHPDLTKRLWINPDETPENGVDDDGNGKVDDVLGWRFYHHWAWDGEKYAYLPAQDNHVADDLGHGTHVAGIAGAEIENGVGVAGMAGGSRLMTVKVLDQYGIGWYFDIARGIVYAVDNGAQVINLSLGGTTPSEALQDAVDYAHDHGVLVVAATGNNGGAVWYPAAAEHVLAVAATDQDDVRAGFSSHGPQVDVAAPGVDIYSTWPWVGEYFTQSGTSMAAPYVSGLAALIWSTRPDLPAAQVTEIMTSTAVDVNAGDLLGWDEYVGWGRIDAGQALSAATRAGGLPLAVSHSQLSVGETAVITVTLPLANGAVVTFTASGGVVSPQVTTLINGVATTVLTAGPVAEVAVITATTNTLTGTLFLRLLPGSAVTATLTPALRQVPPASSLLVTLTAADAFGNPPLDGAPIAWTAKGGTVAPSNTPFDGGWGRVTFTAGTVYGPGTVTATLESRWSIGVVIEIAPAHGLYLPLVLR